MTSQTVQELTNPPTHKHLQQTLETYHVATLSPKSTHITPILKSFHWLKVNERIEYKLLSLSLTKFLQPLNLAIFTTFLFNLLAVTAPHLLSLFLARQPSPP